MRWRELPWLVAYIGGDRAAPAPPKATENPPRDCISRGRSRDRSPPQAQRPGLRNARAGRPSVTDIRRTRGRFRMDIDGEGTAAWLPAMLDHPSPPAPASSSAPTPTPTPTSAPAPTPAPAPAGPPHVVGEGYEFDAVRAQLGGQSAPPYFVIHREGVIVGLCLGLTWNPRAESDPCEVWVGRKEIWPNGEPSWPRPPGRCRSMCGARRAANGFSRVCLK